jgi:hypothetical protein
MVVAQAESPHEPAVTRRSLRGEHGEALRWRRLLRARLDLLVAEYAGPADLDASGLKLLRGAPAAPRTDEMRRAITLGPEADRVYQMRMLRELEHRLDRYIEALDQTLDASTERLVQELLAAELGLDPP